MDQIRARNQRALIAVVQVAALSCWFSASAVAPGMQRDLDLGGTGAVLLTSSVQVGFVVGAVASAVLNLADRVPTAVLYAVSAFLAAACTALIPAVATGLRETLALRVLTGIALAGVYPVGMKLMASWSEPARRGRALGLLVGALTLGSAVPQLIRGLRDLPWPGVLLAASAVTAAGGLAALLLVRRGPNLDTGRTHLEPAYALRMYRQRGPRLVNLGYLGHMWELYAVWTWLPTFVLLSQRDAGGSTGAVVNLTSFLAIGVAGVLGCWLGGVASDRFGRAPAAVTAMVASGTCCLLAAAVLRDARGRARLLPVRLGSRGDRRLRGVLHRTDRDRGPAVRRHRAHRADRDRLPAHRGDHPRGAGAGRCRRLAVRLPRARDRATVRGGRDGPVRTRASRGHDPSGPSLSGATTIRARVCSRRSLTVPGRP